MHLISALIYVLCLLMTSLAVVLDVFIYVCVNECLFIILLTQEHIRVYVAHIVVTGG